MTKPVLIMDQHFRRRDELFSAATWKTLETLCDIHGGQDRPMDRATIEALLPQASFYVAAKPQLSVADLDRASKLRATIEVSGAFHEGLDYEACFARGIEVLSCSPGFRRSVAEMTVAMMLAGARGLVEEHEAFRHGEENWLDDREGKDFTLYGQRIGFIGYGQISREAHRLLQPFAPKVMAYDPFMPAAENVERVDLDTLVEQCRVIIVAAVPSEETRGLLSAQLIAKIQKGSLVIVISRSWCADFSALIEAARTGQLTLATDVFPEEPVAADDPIRQMPNVILSPHRAAAVPGGRQLIGDMILHDVRAILEDHTERELKAADPQMVASLVAAQQNIKAMSGT